MGMNVLIVEDDFTMARAMTRQLRSDHRLTIVATAAEAIDRLGREAFDVVVTDRKLQGDVDGVALLEMIAERFPNIRRVLYSGSAVQEETRAHRALVKPASREELLAA